MEDEIMEFRIIGVSEEAFRYPNLENLRNFNPSDSEFEFAHFYKWNALENIFGVFFRIWLTIISVSCHCNSSLSDCRAH